MPETTMPVMSPTGGANFQNHSDSGDEFVDNFADGPQPGDPQPVQPGVNAPDTHPSETPMGLGGEHGQISSADPPTVATDMQKQPGETRPPDTAASQPPVQPGPGESGAETSPAPQLSEPDAEFPPQLLQMAGLSAEQAKERFSTPKDLFSHVQLEAERWQTSLLGPEGTPPEVPAVPAPVEPVVPAPQETQQQPELKPFEIDEQQADELDPVLVELIGKMNDHYQGQLEAVHSRVGQRERDFAERSKLDEAAQFDSMVQGLGNDWQDFFGEGPIQELEKTAPRDPVAFTNLSHRKTLREAAIAVRDAGERRGVHMDLEQAMSWALMQRYPDRFAQLLPGNTSPGRPGATASRPTARHVPHATQNERTLSAVDQMLRKKGRPGGLDMGRDEEEWEGPI